MMIIQKEKEVQQWLENVVLKERKNGLEAKLGYKKMTIKRV